MTCKECVHGVSEIKPGDKIFYAIYDAVFPEESYVSSNEVFDVGTKGIYILDGELVEFYSYEDVGKSIFLTEKDAQKELLCMIARG